MQVKPAEVRSCMWADFVASFCIELCKWCVEMWHLQTIAVAQQRIYLSISISLYTAIAQQCCMFIILLVEARHKQMAPVVTLRKSSLQLRTLELAPSPTSILCLTFIVTSQRQPPTDDKDLRRFSMPLYGSLRHSQRQIQTRAMSHSQRPTQTRGRPLQPRH